MEDKPNTTRRALLNRLVILLLVMLLYPIAFHWPAHAMFTRLFPSPSDIGAMDRALAPAPR